MPPRDAPPPAFPETPEARARRLNYPVPVEGVLPHVLGAQGKERYQLWPERAVRDALGLPGDIVSGREPIWDPFTGHISEGVIPRAFDAAGMGMTGGLVGGVGGHALGAGPLRPPPAAARVHPEIGGSRMVDKTGWRVVEGEPHPYTGYREIKIYDADGNWKGSRSTSKPTEEVLAEWGEPPKPVRRPAQRPAPVRITSEPDGNVPEVVWEQRDLQDSSTPTPATIMKDYGRGKGIVTQGFIDMDSLPKAKLSGGRDSYDWSELQWGNSEPPPVKIRINPNGSATILDGNHRIEWWREKGYDQAPAWIIDERSNPTVLTAGGRRGEAGIAAAAVSAEQPLYSAAARAMQQLGMPRASAGQWLATLRNRGVRDEELEAIGLKGMKPDQILTHEQILDMISDGLPDVQMVVKGRTEVSPEEVLETARKRADYYGNDWEEMSPGLQLQYLEEVRRGLLTGDVKFSQYTLPGGQNYREVLFTLPHNSRDTTGWTVRRSPGVREGEQIVHILDEEGARVASTNVDSRVTDQDLIKIYASQIEDRTSSSPNYRSTHWDEPNVLAHARVDDRWLTDPSKPAFDPKSLTATRIGEVPGGGTEWRVTGPQGQSTLVEVFGDGDMARQDAIDQVARGMKSGNSRTLFIEEIQSDWHQAGRKSGYKLPAQELQRLETRQQELHKLINDPQRALPGQLAEWTREWIDIQNATGLSTSHLVPDAPFKTTWPEYVLKRLVDDAVRGGYDAVAWTDGATQAARYNLSNHVDAIQAVRQNDGTFKLKIKHPTGHRSFDWDTFHEGYLSESELPNYVGRDLTDHMIDMEPGTTEVFQGVDLQVGGEGMRGFYDDMLPRIANRLYKRDGARVSDGSLPATTGHTDGQLRAALLGEMPREIVNALSPQELRRVAQEHDIDAGGPGPRIHILRITPAMRERVLREGQPLFSAGVPGMGELSPRGRQHGQGPTTGDEDPRWANWDPRTGA
jgi:hypothetical protein